MRVCRVLGPLWAAAKHPMYAGQKLMVVQPVDTGGAPVGPSYVAVDRVQAGAGVTRV